MGIKVRVYEDFNGIVEVADKVKGFSEQDWAILIDEIKQIKQIKDDDGEVYTINFYGAEAKDGEYAFPEPCYFAFVSIENSKNESLVKFSGINVENDDKYLTESLADRHLEIIWRKWLIAVNGIEYANVIINELERIEKRTQKAIHVRINEEIEDIQQMVSKTNNV